MDNPAQTYNIGHPDCDPRIDYARWPLVSYGNTSPSQALNADGTVNYAFMSALGNWLRDHPDPVKIVHDDFMEASPFNTVEALQRIEAKIDVLCQLLEAKRASPTSE